MNVAMDSMQGSGRGSASPRSGSAAAGTMAPGPTLVNSAISHRSQFWKGQSGLGKAGYFAVESFQAHRYQVRIIREKKAFDQPAPKKKRGLIQLFSKKSRSRLRHKAADADPALISMFTATYADGGPKDGEVVKRHLDSFLKRIRRKFRDFGYLWVLEFQGAGNNYAPHLHVFLTLEHSIDLGHFLGKAWHEIAGAGKEKHKQVALHPSSFIAWDMGTGNYVCKYLDKLEQKEIPEGYQNVGRFWGASSGLVPSPSVVKAREMAVALLDVAPKAVKQATRWLCKWHEKHTNGRSRARRTGNSYTIPTGAPILRQILRYLINLEPPKADLQESPF